MRILHVLDRSLPTIAGYTSRSAAILEHQAALGLAPRALTSPRQGGGDPEVIHGITYARTEPPDVIGALDRVPVLREAAEMTALTARILAMHREAPFDLIHAHSPILCGLPAHLAARRLGLPHVYEIRAFWEDAAEQRGHGRAGSARYTATRAAETLLVKRADAVVTICEGLRRDLAARGVAEDRLFVVQNGVDVDRFTPRPRDPDLEDRLAFRGKTVIAYVGTLFRYEGVGTLVAALGRLSDARDDLRGLIVGHGETEDELRAAVDTFGLRGRVAVVGATSPAEVGRYYSLADILCYPRLRHRITELVTPLKPLEAMAMGKAVIASNVGGLRELVRDGDTGVLFEAADPEALASAIARLAGDVDLRRQIGERARAFVHEERSWREIARRYLDVYEAAAARQRAGVRTRPARAAE